MLKLKLAMVPLCGAMILPAAPVLRAQAGGDATNAPIPSQIVTAKKVFISNAGGRFFEDITRGEKSQTYNEFYAAIRNWGHYQLVGSPNEADLVFQAELDPMIPDHQAINEIRLELRDPKTNVLLWTIEETIGMKGHAVHTGYERDLGEAMDKLVEELKALTAPPAAK